jgi:hypothetical protein
MFQRLIQTPTILFFVFLVFFGFGIDAARAQFDETVTGNRVEGRGNGNAANVPANLAAWHGGDGDTRDFTGANDGRIIFSNTNFIVGKVGQALSFNPVIGGSGGGVQINSPSIFRGQTEGTIETWVRLRGLPIGTFGFSAVWVETEQNRFTRFGILYNQNGQLAAYSNFSNAVAITPAAVPQNEWLHVAAVHKAGEPLRLYINGVLAASSSTVGEAFTDAPSPFIAIGTLVTLAGDDFSLRGDVDDASVYTRALSASEIQTIYNAGTAGKLRRVVTSVGTNVSVSMRDATVTFANVVTAGDTAQTPLETSAIPALPQGFAHSGLAYDISTTAAASGNIDVCFNLPALVGEGFSRLRVLHMENGIWIDRTTIVNSPQLCGRVSNLSLFVIAENLAPTAASVVVGGRVTNTKGRGVNRARISLTDAAGETRYAITNSFGYYNFTDVPAGAAYILSAQSKRYGFEPSTRVLFVNEELVDADFTAYENKGRLFYDAVKRSF